MYGVLFLYWTKCCAFVFEIHQSVLYLYVPSHIPPLPTNKTFTTWQLDSQTNHWVSKHSSENCLNWLSETPYQSLRYLIGFLNRPLLLLRGIEAFSINSIIDIHFPGENTGECTHRILMQRLRSKKEAQNELKRARGEISCAECRR